MRFSTQYKNINNNAHKILGHNSTRKLFTRDNEFISQSGLYKMNKQLIDGGSSYWIAEVHTTLTRFLGLK